MQGQPTERISLLFAGLFPARAASFKKFVRELPAGELPLAQALPLAGRLEQRTQQMRHGFEEFPGHRRTLQFARTDRK